MHHHRRLVASALLIMLALPGLTSASTPAPTPEAQVAEALQGPLRGFIFNKRLATPGQRDNVLLFAEPAGPATRIVYWTNAPGERYAAIPASPMEFSLRDIKGKEIEKFTTTDEFTVILQLEREPRILVPTQPNDFLRIAAAAERVQSPLNVRGPQTLDLSCTFNNPFDRQLLFTSEDPPKQAMLRPGGRYTLKKSVPVGRPAQPLIVPIEGMGVVQQVVINVDNPLHLEIWPQLDRNLTLTLLNPAADPFRGEAEIHLITGEDDEPEPFRFPIAMTSNERSRTINIPLNFEGALPLPIRLAVTQRSRAELGQVFTLAETPPTLFVQLPRFTASSPGSPPDHYEGRSQGGTRWSMTAGTPPEGAPAERYGTLILVYSFHTGGVGIKVLPKQENLNIEGIPAGYGLWVHGDNSGNFITCGIRDANRRIFQPDPIKVDWQGWRYLTFRWPSGMTPPLQWDSIIELINADAEKNGALLVNNPVLLYEDIESPELRDIRATASSPPPPALDPDASPPPSISDIPSAIPTPTLPNR